MIKICIQMLVWTVIPVERRKTYTEAFEKASVDQDVELFAKFIAHLVNEAKEDQWRRSKREKEYFKL